MGVGFLVDSERETNLCSRLAHAEHALNVARRERDADLELVALGRAGLADIALGRVDEGMTKVRRSACRQLGGRADRPANQR